MYTILIPSINRSDFLIKHIKYLKDNKFTGQLLIGDSSNKKHYEITRDFPRGNKSKLRPNRRREIWLSHFPEGFATRIKCLVNAAGIITGMTAGDRHVSRFHASHKTPFPRLIILGIEESIVVSVLGYIAMHR